jgi:hypothetical protein
MHAIYYIDMDEFPLYGVKEKKVLRDKISFLSSTEHYEIFKMISGNDNYTKNTNGIFFDLTNLSDETISEISKFVTFCIENKVVLDEYDRKYNECKNQNSYEKVSPPSAQHNLVNIDNKNSIENLIKASKGDKRMEQYNYLINAHTEKLFKKNTSSKFTNARKKYAKKIIQDKKIESEQQSNLNKEQYIIYND